MTHSPKASPARSGIEPIALPMSCPSTPGRTSIVSPAGAHMRIVSLNTTRLRTISRAYVPALMRNRGCGWSWASSARYRSWISSSGVVATRRVNPSTSHMAIRYGAPGIRARSSGIRGDGHDDDVVRQRPVVPEDSMGRGGGLGLHVGLEDLLALRALDRPVLVGVQPTVVRIDLHESEGLADRGQPLRPLRIALEGRQLLVGDRRAEEGEARDRSYPASSSACLANDLPLIASPRPA